MKISELARLARSNAETIRYYEREGLLSKASRSESNYRIYTAAHLERLIFIKHCRNLDMTLGEIRTLLRFKASPEENCGEVNRLLDEHIEHVVRRIGELQELERQLRDLRECCPDGRQAAACGILEGLSQPSLEKTPGNHVPGVHASFANNINKS
ncbi:MAG: Cd(II)/Pb(II)-responsive transcriptional regulator [Rhodocyclales bacterium]|jgi:Cd(II)/Pb(II)-responsive transcriptional regulator|nr:Cd(II)/Pb(II)-responsive transcriptional regulator [Rhodocyclales bacterium]